VTPSAPPLTHHSASLEHSDLRRLGFNYSSEGFNRIKRGRAQSRNGEVLHPPLAPFPTCSGFKDRRPKTMLTHIVLWKYRPDVEPEDREEHVRLLRSLASAIKEVESLSVGFDVLHLPRSFDTGLVAVFKDRAALDAYTIHPEHIKVAEFGRSISAQVGSVDFED
jgi:quinol monooxygenase YgiN